MNIEMNITDTNMDLDRFSGREDLRQFYRSRGIDGLELMPCMGTELPSTIAPEDVIGIHLKYFPCWVEFWRGNEEALKEEYGDKETWSRFYGGTTRQDLLKPFRDQLDLAQRIGARYVVFHVSECTLEVCPRGCPSRRIRNGNDLECVLLKTAFMLAERQNHEY